MKEQLKKALQFIKGFLWGFFGVFVEALRERWRNR